MYANQYTSGGCLSRDHSSSPVLRRRQPSYLGRVSWPRQTRLGVDAAADRHTSAAADSARRCPTLAERPCDDPPAEYEQEAGEECDEAGTEERIPVTVVKAVVGGGQRFGERLIARASLFAQPVTGCSSSCRILPIIFHHRRGVSYNGVLPTSCTELWHSDASGSMTNWNVNDESISRRRSSVHSAAIHSEMSSATTTSLSSSTFSRRQGTQVDEATWSHWSLDCVVAITADRMDRTVRYSSTSSTNTMQHRAPRGYVELYDPNVHGQHAHWHALVYVKCRSLLVTLEQAELIGAVRRHTGGLNTYMRRSSGLQSSNNNKQTVLPELRCSCSLLDRLPCRSRAAVGCFAGGRPLRDTAASVERPR